MTLDIEVSQRATAKMLGVSKDTVAGDLGKRGGENSPPDDKKQEKTADGEPGNGENSPPAWFQDDVDPAKLAKGQPARHGENAGGESINGSA